MSSDEQKRLVFECLPTQIKDKRGQLIRVQVYEASDFEGLRQMYDRFEPKGLECGLPPYDNQVRLRWLHHLVSNLFNVLAIYGDRVIGHSAMALSCSPLCPEYLIFIEKGFRNRGIGTALSAVMKEVAKKSGCVKVVLTVRTANTRAIKVFKRTGFSFCGKIEPCRDMEMTLKSARTGCRIK